MKQWEYYSFSYPLHIDSNAHIAELNSFGEQGWELVSVAVFNGNKNFYFKRPKISSDPSLYHRTTVRHPIQIAGTFH